jgi:hypothetical protein
VFPLPFEGDHDDLAGLVQTTLGPFRLERRLGGPYRDDVDHVGLVPTSDTEDDE